MNFINHHDPNLAKIELVAGVLGPLRERLVFVDGFAIRLITAPAFLGTKFEAFSDRGKCDMLGSHDLEDIIAVLDGRPELPDEVAGTSGELRAYLATRCRGLIATPGFSDYLPGMIAPSETLGERATILADRLQQITRLA